LGKSFNSSSPISTQDKDNPPSLCPGCFGQELKEEAFSLLPPLDCRQAIFVFSGNTCFSFVNEDVAKRKNVPFNE
jgi:hypothetical protein